MAFHFDSRLAATNHLAANGWREIANGSWVSKDGSCAARITECHGSVVCVMAWEI